MKIKYFDDCNINDDYIDTTIIVDNQEVDLDLNLDAVMGTDKWVPQYEEYVSKLEALKKEIERAIKKDFENNGTVKEWIDFHVEEIWEYIEPLLKEDYENQNLPKDRFLLSKLKLHRIGIYPDYKFYAVWDFVLDKKSSDEILVIITNENGKITDITWES